MFWKKKPARREVIEQATANPGELRHLPYSTPRHQMAHCLATSVWCSCGTLMTNYSEAELREHARG